MWHWCARFANNGLWIITFSKWANFLKECRIWDTTCRKLKCWLIVQYGPSSLNYFNHTLVGRMWSYETKLLRCMNSMKHAIEDRGSFGFVRAQHIVLLFISTQSHELHFILNMLQKPSITRSLAFSQNTSHEGWHHGHPWLCTRWWDTWLWPLPRPLDLQHVCLLQHGIGHLKNCAILLLDSLTGNIGS